MIKFHTPPGEKPQARKRKAKPPTRQQFSVMNTITVEKDPFCQGEFFCPICKVETCGDYIQGCEPENKAIPYPVVICLKGCRKLTYLKNGARLQPKH